MFAKLGQTGGVRRIDSLLIQGLLDGSRPSDTVVPIQGVRQGRYFGLGSDGRQSPFTRVGWICRPPLTHAPNAAVPGLPAAHVSSGAAVRSRLEPGAMCRCKPDRAHAIRLGYLIDFPCQVT